MINWFLRCLMNLECIIRNYKGRWIVDHEDEEAIILKRRSKVLKKKWFKSLIVFFIFLTIIKLFTAKVGLIGDPTVLLVIKPNPTISNEFIMMGEETEANILKYKGTWFYEKKYYVLTGDEMGFSGENVYDVMIFLWWLLGVGMILLITGNYINNKKMNKFA